MSHIANLSFQTGIFPQKMKIAKVIPIYKSKDNKNFQNYRPVSLLPCFSKVIERLVYNRLYSYLKTNKILIPEQFGFQTNLSTDMAILALQNLLAKNISENSFALGLFLDLSKAFDTLDHNILLKKLSHYGIRGVAFDWFRSYLSDRQQFTYYKSASSTKLPISCGVPQGSILGPLLFLVYINDIKSTIDISRAILFADDTNLILTDKCVDSLISKASREIDAIFNWFNANKLSLNTEKTKYILFRSPQTRLPTTDNVTIDGKPIEQVKSIKFLGVHIDEFLKWEEHIKLKNNQIAKNLSVINRVKHDLQTRTMKTLYDSLILPHLTYGVVAWGNTCKKAIKRMHLLQKRAVRIISKSKFNAHTGPIFKSLKILTIHDIYRLNCCKLFWKKIHKKLPQLFLELIPLNNETHSYETRQQNNVRPASSKTRLSDQQLSIKIATAFNNLSNSLKDSINMSIVSFSKNIKAHFLLKYPNTCPKPDCYNCKK